MKAPAKNPLMKTLASIGAAVAFFAVFAATALAADTQNLTRRTFIDLIKDSKPACLNLTCFGRAFGSQALGSGFVVKDGKGNFLVVTNKHVAEGAAVIKAESGNGAKQELVLEVARISHQADLAILRIVSCPDKNRLKAISLGDSDAVEEGQWVLAIGNPLGQEGSSSIGIISRVGRELSSPSFHYPHRFFQMDMAINPGNSGGPLIDLDGKVIAIIVAKSGGEGMAFAIPSNLVKEEIALIGGGNSEVRPGWLGLAFEPADADTLACFGQRKELRGFLITAVQPDSPAEKAGLRQGDVITHCDGEEVTGPARPELDREKLERKILNTSPGAKITLTVVSPGQAPRTAVLTVAAKE